MIECQTKQVEKQVVSAKICDRCKQRFERVGYDCAMFRAYDDVWHIWHESKMPGDNDVTLTFECELCSPCAHEILGPYLRQTRWDE